jgi:hypothetical protein
MRRLALLILVLLLAGFLGRPTVANGLSDLVLSDLASATAAVECEAQPTMAQHVQPCPEKAPLRGPPCQCNVGVLPVQVLQLSAGADVTPVSHAPWQPAFRVHHSQFRPPREA